MIEFKRYGEWILVLVTIIAAFGWVFSKEAIKGMPPLGFIGLRFFCAAIILLPVCTGSHQRIDLTNIPKAIFAGFLQSVNIIFWILAISFNGALGEGSFIMSLSALMIPLVAWLFFKQKPLAIFWFSLPIAVIGLAFLTLSNGWHTSTSQFCFFAAALAQAIFFIFNSRFVQKIAVLPLTCIQLFFTGICCTILSYLFESWPSMLSLATLGWFAASVLIATSLRYALQLVGQKYVPVGNAAIIMILEPVFTTIAGVVIYSELMTGMKWLGCLLILISLLVYRGYLFIRTRRISTVRANDRES